MTDTPATTTLATPDDSVAGGVLEATDLTLPVPSEVWSHPVDAWTQAQEALNPLRSSGVDRVIAPVEEGPHYRGPVAVLMGPACMSSNESFVLMMRTCSRVALVVAHDPVGRVGEPDAAVGFHHHVIG